MAYLAHPPHRRQLEYSDPLVLRQVQLPLNDVVGPGYLSMSARPRCSVGRSLWIEYLQEGREVLLFLPLKHDGPFSGRTLRRAAVRSRGKEEHALEDNGRFDESVTIDAKNPILHLIIPQKISETWTGLGWNMGTGRTLNTTKYHQNSSSAAICCSGWDDMAVEDRKPRLDWHRTRKPSHAPKPCARAPRSKGSLHCGR